MSQDGGLEWREVLKKPHIYAFGDHGGLIVAAKQKEITGEITYVLKIEVISETLCKNYISKKGSKAK